MFRLPLQRLAPGSLAVAVLLSFGCATAHDDRHPDDAPPAPPPVAMRGEALFFAGQLHVETTITRGRPGGFARSGGEHGHGHGGGGHRRHGGGMGGMDEGLGGSRADAEDEAGAIGGMRMRAATMPAVTLHLQLENRSSEPLDVQIRDFKSDLGDFAVRPERVQLAPGQSVDVDPMVSQLGVTSDEIPVTVSLRAAGKTETHDVLVKNLFTPGAKTE